MPNKILRRKKSTWAQDTRHTLAVGLLVLLSLGLLNAAAGKVFPYIWIDLQRVQVPDHDAGGDPTVTAWPEINRDFRGYWETRIRRAADDRIICKVPGLWINYKASASEHSRVIQMPLSEWMRDDAALKACAADGFGPGDYYLVTCHTTHPFGVTALSRCVESNTFSRR